MAAGKTHARVAATALLAGSVGGLFLVLADPTLTPIVAPVLVGLVNGYLVTPDIDIDHMTEEEKRWKAIPLIGNAVSILFSWFWYLYSRLFRHRGVSHWPFVGTFTRMAYQFAGFVFWSLTIKFWSEYLIGQDLGGALARAIFALPWQWFWWMFLGWAVQDLLHLLFDWKPKERTWGLWQVVALTGTTVLIFWLLWQATAL